MINEAPILLTMFPVKASVPDRSHSVITPKQFLELVRQARKFYRKLRIPKGSKAWDCENYSGTMTIFATAYYARYWAKEAGAEGIAVGDFSYIRRDGIAHSASVALIQDGQQGFDVVYFEPQMALKKGKVYDLWLTPEEHASIFKVEFR